MMRLNKYKNFFILVILPASIILDCSPSSGAEYQWFDPDTGYTASNPLDVCRPYIIELESNPDRNRILLPETIRVRAFYSYFWNGEVISAGCRYDYLVASALKLGIEQRFTTDGGSAHRKGDSCIGGKIYNPVTGICGQDKEMGTPEQISCVGNPISVKSGNKFQQETDYSNGVFEISRYYNSSDGLWRSSFSDNIKVTYDGSQAYLSRSDGGTSSYTISGERVLPEVIGTGDLKKTESGWKYSSPVGETLEFDTAGRLIRYLSQEKRQYEISYDNFTLSIKDNATDSKKLVLTLDAQGQPLRILVDGVQLIYNYQEGRLVSMSKTNGESISTRKFLYEKDNKKLLTGIIDERGVRFATWDYDTQGRAISSQHAGGAGLTTVTYSENSSTVTNELGKKTIYNYQMYRGINRITSIIGEPSPNCLASNSSYTYSDQGQLQTKIDAKGLVTIYTYNERGLETSRTEARGTSLERTIFTEWDATRFLPIRVTVPGRVTSYSYDEDGRLSQKNTSQEAPIFLPPVPN